MIAGLHSALEGRYVLERELGRGGMATVYLARDLRHDRPVALKILHPELAQALGAERFQREIRMAARLQHPHILTVYDSGEVPAPPGGSPILWFTMPFIEGESLRDRLNREKQLPLDDALRIAREAADALDYAHHHGVVHRDMKPENILLTPRHALVADFGIARGLSGGAEEKLTQTGMAVGTPAYMSPEQAGGERELDARTDIYSLATVLYEMLAGETPFSGPTAQAMIARRFMETPRPLRQLRETVPEGVEQAVQKGLARAPADRYMSAAEFADALLPSPADPASRPSASITQPAARAERRGVGLRRRMGRRGALYLALAIITSIGGYNLARSLAGRAERAGGTRHLVERSKSIAVLPFVNMSPEKENEYFSDGMTEELINALSKLPGLRVAARTSAFAFKGRQQDVREIGKALDVGTLLEGSVRKADNRLRVTAQLINAADGYHLWSETYDRELKDVFAVQDEISRAIITALQLKLGAAAAVVRAGRPTEDLEAHNLYLQGRYYWNKRTAEGLTKGIEYFEQAIAKDPEYALAYAGLAESYVVLGGWQYLPPKEAYPKATAAALQALAIDESLAEAHVALAFSKWVYDLDWSGAEREFRRAIELNPGYATGRQWYALYLNALGRAEESIAEMKRAQELDPLSLIISAEVGWMYYFARRYDQAITQYRKTLDMDPNFAPAHQFLGEAYERKRMFAEAIAEHQRATTLAGGRARYLSELGRAYAEAGRRAEALQILDKLRAESRRQFVSAYYLAAIYAALGDKERAFELLDRAVAESDTPAAQHIKVDPALDPLRSDPRFAPLLKKLRLE